MAVFKCKMCGGTLEVQPGTSVVVCDYCGSTQTIPNLSDDRRANLFDRANHFRRANEFDKAMNLYEQILNEDNSDAEAHWGVVLCRYGIEYVEDPATHKRIPTVNRAQLSSVLADEDYKAAIQYADGYQRDVYEAEAKQENVLQQNMQLPTEQKYIATVTAGGGYGRLAMLSTLSLLSTLQVASILLVLTSILIISLFVPQCGLA